MEDKPSSHVSSSFSEFALKERALNDLRRFGDEHKSSGNNEFQSKDADIDSILQRMGRILSPAGQELDNKVYKRVINETKNKTIEQILYEAKELVGDDVLSVDNASADLITDDSTSVDSEVITTLINNSALDSDDDSVENCFKSFSITNAPTAKHNEIESKKRGGKSTDKQVETMDNKLHQEIQYLRNEVKRISTICASHENETYKMKSEIDTLQQEWTKREKQLMEENCLLKQHGSFLLPKQLESLNLKLNDANATITDLRSSIKKINSDWKKKEMKLVNECDRLRHQLKSPPKFAQPDFEKVQEQLKDSEERNVKLKIDFEECKERCDTLENLCTDLKKVIIDEHLAEKVYANDSVPTPVKQYLSSSSSVINTLSSMFGCLSRGSNRSRNMYSGQKEKNDLFTTCGSQMMNDFGKYNDSGELIKEILKEKEQMRKENQDLNRQVKELENIVRRRVHPNYSQVSEIIKNGEPRKCERDNEAMLNLKKELLDKQHIIIDLKNQLVESKAQHDQNLLSLQSKIVNIQEESIRMKEELEKKTASNISYTMSRNRRKGRSCDPPPSSFRSVRTELSAKEREVQQLNKQLEELKKTNRKLVKDKENYYLSSREPSAEEIRQNRNMLSSPRRTNQKAAQFSPNNASPKKKVNSHDYDSPVQNIPCISKSSEIEHNECHEANTIDTNKTGTFHSNTQNVADTPSLNKTDEGNIQVAQQLVLDLLTLLTKEDVTGIKQSNLGQEQLSQMVSSLKNKVT